MTTRPEADSEIVREEDDI